MPRKKFKGPLALIESMEPEWMQKIHFPAWMILILALIFLFRIPSFVEPFHYGDEMIYLALGNAIRRGQVLYLNIHDNKPPLLYFTAALAGNVFWFRAILAGWMMATTVAFWKLVESLFKNEKTQQAMVTVFAILTTIPLLEGQIANAELFMIGPTILAFYILLNKKLTIRNLVFAGVLFSIATLYKVPAAFDVGTIIFMWIVGLKFKSKSIPMFIKNSVVLAIGFSAPILLTLVWYASRGAFHDYLVSAFLQNFGYLSSFRPGDVTKPFLTKNGPLIIRGLILLGSLLLLWLFRKKLSKPFIFSSSWLLFGLFAVTLSERPYPHYLIQIVPAIAILIGMLLTNQTIEQSLSLLPLMLVVAALIKFQFWYYPSIPYYENFFKFFSGNETKEAYFAYFNPDSKRNYDVARFLATASKPTDKIFVWGNSSVIYALANRPAATKYVATYHIIDFSSQEQIINDLSKSKPKFIIILPDSPPFPSLREFIEPNYFPTQSVDGVSIWRRNTASVNAIGN